MSAERASQEPAATCSGDTFQRHLMVVGGEPSD